MSENVKIQVRANGSLRVTGTMDFVDAEGTIIKTETNFSLCRCGHSKEKPFCDGSHREVGFEAPALQLRADLEDEN
jgi:CDGSH-type Zn-finger protein